MANPVKRYQQEMHNKVGFFATWLPGNLIQPGDFGVLKEAGF